MMVTLASKINMALSRVVSSNSNGNMLEEEDEDIADLIQLLEELNAHTDLTVKLNNQSKICKILQGSPDIRVSDPSE